MKWNWTSFLIHSWKPQCWFYQKQIWRPCGAPWVSLNPGSLSSLKLICSDCLGRNHNRSGSIASLFMKNTYWPFPCLIRVTRGDKSHKTQYFPKRAPNPKPPVETHSTGNSWASLSSGLPSPGRWKWLSPDLLLALRRYSGDCGCP